MSSDLAVRDDMSLNDLGAILAKSGFFSDAREASQCVVKVLAGRELGFGPIASMTGVYIVKGRVSLSANLMAAAVRRSGRYTFAVRELTDKGARIEFFEIVGGKREPLGISEFTLADAQKAGTQNLDKFPRNMLYARAMSNGVKWFCPDVTGGPIYTPDELGEPVNEDGEIVTDTASLARQAPVIEMTARTIETSPAAIKATAATFDPAALSAALDWLGAIQVTSANAAEVKQAVTAYAEQYGVHLNGNAKTLADAVRIVRTSLEELATR